VKRKRILMLIAALALLSMTGKAAPRPKAQMKEAAIAAINAERARVRKAPRPAGEVKLLKQSVGYEIYGFEHGGFAVVSSDDLVPELLGVSSKRYSEGRNTNFQWWLSAMSDAVDYAVQNNIALAPIAPDPAKFPTQVGPLMTTEWDQLDPYNMLLPLSNGGDRLYTGCVATAMAQVLNYYKVPEHGVGQRTIYYPQYDTSGSAITATFEDDYYDWDNMLDNYAVQPYNDAQAQAVALLMRDCGVAADMQYGGYQESGSGAYSTDAAEGLRTYFGLTDATCYERDGYNGPGYSDQDWMDMVFTALSEDGPIYYGGSSYYSGGHAFVLHGYNAQGMVYVNWGWSGDDDGYYDISLLNPSYYQFSTGQDMIIGVRGERRELVDKELTLDEAGSLNSLITEEELGYVGTLTLTGNINSSDLLYLRKLAGVDEYNERTDGRLHDLDLSQAHIVEGGNPFLIDGTARLTTTENELPERAFYGCRQLKSLKLPAGLKHWGDGALALCTQLSDLEIGAPDAEADFVIDEQGMVWNVNDATDLIAVLPSTSGDLEIPDGTVNIRNYALAGCARLNAVIIPASVTTIGREAFRNASSMSELRVKGKEVPTLAGNDVFTGMSMSACTLYVRSGMKTKFGQKAQWKDFINVVEFGTTVKVRNTIRKYGEENPEFTFNILGDYVEGMPEMTCEATPLSPAGRYPIYISPGTITDELVEFEDGYLVVQKVEATATVVNATREQGQPNPEFELTFEGLVNDETVPVWISEPVFTCEADETSEPGEYPITVTAEAESYKLAFVAGVLTVTESVGTGIAQPSTLNPQRSTTYDLSGRRIDRPTKGVYIQNGRKVILK
jgi:hypothetical protein